MHGQVAISRGSTTSGNSDAGNGTQSMSLLKNFQDMFKVDQSFILRLHQHLIDPSTSFILIFVDLDNIPKFFKDIPQRTVVELPYQVFVVCSARFCTMRLWKSKDNVHFTHAMPTKDAADAVCTMASAKLDSILVQMGRQHDVPLIIVSNDKIFQQVARLLREGGSHAAIASRNDVRKGVQMLRRMLILAGSLSPALSLALSLAFSLSVSA
jgi:hypothetical protein